MADTFAYLTGATDFEPTAAYEHLREQCPLYHETDHDPPFYVLSRFDDVVNVLKQPTLWEQPPTGRASSTRSPGVLGSADNPDHARHRRILQPAFLPTAIARLEPRSRPSPTSCSTRSSLWARVTSSSCTPRPSRPS